MSDFSRLDNKLDQIILQLGEIQRLSAKVEHLEKEQHKLNKELDTLDFSINGDNGLRQKITKNSLITTGLIAVATLFLSALITTFSEKAIGTSDEQNRQTATTRFEGIKYAFRESWMEVNTRTIAREPTQRSLVTRKKQYGS